MKRAALVGDLAGLGLLVCGLVAGGNSLHRAIDPYDESILLLDAALMNGGAVPYRDFYTAYAPGTFQVLRALFDLFGETALTSRALALGLHLAIALLLGRLTGMILGRRLALLPAGVAMLWLAQLGLVPLAFLFGLLVALICTLLFHSARLIETRTLWLVFGGTFALGTYFRHDLFIYLALPTALLIALALRPVQWAHRARALVGFGVVALLLWVPVFFSAGAQVVDDLFLDQLRYVRPARLLPLPAFRDALVNVHPASALLALLAPVIALLSWRFAKRLALDRPLVVALGVLAVAVLPHALGRADTFHTIPAALPGIALLWCYAESLAARLRTPLFLLPLLLFGAFLVTPVRHALTLERREPAKTLSLIRGAGTVPYDGREELVDEITKRTAPGEPIFVGLVSHKYAVANELDLYFLSGRPGATRYTQFEPGLVSREDVQRAMIEQLERKRVRLAVLNRPLAEAREPNTPQLAGSDVLDTYLHEHFTPVVRLGNTWLVVERR